MAPEHRDYIRELAIYGLKSAIDLENTFLALLEGEDLEAMSPARFATVANRAALLTKAGINWDVEVIRARLLPEGFLTNLAIKLGTGEIDGRKALAELSEREAEITCRVGGLFLSEVVKLMNRSGPPAG